MPSLAMARIMPAEETKLITSYDDLIVDILKGYEEKFDRMPPPLECIDSMLGSICPNGPD